MLSSGSGLDPGLFAQVESDLLDTDTDEFQAALDAYRVPRSLFPQHRVRMDVDLVGGALSIEVVEAFVLESAPERLALSYLELFVTVNRLEPDVRIPLTMLDLGVLRNVLAANRDQVVQHLEQLMSDDHPVAGPLVRGHGRTVAALSAAALLGVAFLVALAVHGDTAGTTGTAPAQSSTAQPVELPGPAVADLALTPTAPAGAVAVGAVGTVGLIPPLAVERGPDGVAVEVSPEQGVAAATFGLIPPMAVERGPDGQLVDVSQNG